MQTATHQDYRYSLPPIDHDASFRDKMMETLTWKHCELKNAEIRMQRDEYGNFFYEFPNHVRIGDLIEAHSYFKNNIFTNDSK